MASLEVRGCPFSLRSDRHLGGLLSWRVLADGADPHQHNRIAVRCQVHRSRYELHCRPAGNGSRKNGVYLRPATCRPALGVREGEAPPVLLSLTFETAPVSKKVSLPDPTRPQCPSERAVNRLRLHYRIVAGSGPQSITRVGLMHDHGERVIAASLTPTDSPTKTQHRVRRRRITFWPLGCTAGAPFWSRILELVGPPGLEPGTKAL
jgi:hypothetical protein